MLDLHRLCRDMCAPKSALRREADGHIAAIAAFLRAPSPRTAAMLADWREDFRLFYGGSALSAHNRLAAELLPRSGDADPEEGGEEALPVLALAVQTYFSLLVKCAVSRLLGQDPGGLGWPGVLLGEAVRRRGVTGYCGEDRFCWPLYELEAGFDRVLEAVDRQTARYETGASASPFRAGRDDVKLLYESLVPARLRHALGEYYTPDWLAAYTLERALSLGGGAIRSLRLTDPACGSGTFLLQAIARKRQAGCGLEEILSTVRGFDINPLAVLTAKTNYLLAVLDLLEDPAEPVALPVFRADVLETGREGPKADLVIGNPPWVNWEYLPPDYRQRSRGLWSEYGLLEARGRELSFLKADVSDLITYVAADRLLARGGTLAFLLRQGVFKSARNGARFRRFRLPDGTGLAVLGVDDLSGLKVFGGAAAGAAALFARKGEQTRYPVPYTVWEKAPGAKRGPIEAHASLEEVMTRVTAVRQQAMPAGDAPDAPWLTAPAEDLARLRRLLGTNPYQARTGVFTGGANAVYWLTVRSAGDGVVSAANLVRRAKRKVPPVEAELEDVYLFPMLKGSGIRRWRTRYDSYLLCPHTARTRLRPVPWEQLEAECPRTAAYLASFRDTLDRRKGFAGWERFIQQQSFHAVLRVGAYTFAPWKVVWKYIASEFVCAVAGTVDDPWLGEKLLLPNEKVMYVAAGSEEEAYYLCGVLSSAPVARCVRGYMNPTSISAHVLGKLAIPPYDPADPVHREIAGQCRQGHAMEDPAPCLRAVDELAEELWNA